MEKDIRYVRSVIEDLAFTSRSSRAAIWGYPHIVGDVVLSTTLPKEQGCGQAQEQRLEWKRLGVNVRSSKPPRKTMREWR
jgi:ATP-dependent RNA circularization protein (DNA/RNA ligase family)